MNEQTYLTKLGAKQYGDLPYSIHGKDYYIGQQNDTAFIVAFLPNEVGCVDDCIFFKKELREMALNARVKGIDRVELHTNYGLELHCEEGPDDVDLDDIVKLINLNK